MEKKTEDMNEAFVVSESAQVMGEIRKKDRRDKKKKKKDMLMELLLYLILLLLGAIVIPRFVLQRIIVDGPSMEPTLKDGENLMIEKLSVAFNNLKRFDVIVFYPTGKTEEEYYIKRIIGMPGETVQILDGRILINGEILEEAYGKDDIISYAGSAAAPITLKDDEYFVLGDNREISSDSRYQKVGNVKKDSIGGKVLLRIWPLSKFGSIQ